MKLLNCQTRQIEEFSGTRIPKSYAILSHRWEDDEVIYQDLQTPEIATQKAGWRKIENFCRVALDNGYEYVWIDTCCINKRDLTELTEAINSMFKWYANSAVCYTHLSDITLGQPLEDSLWFTRGWNLQELIASARMEFFDKDWKRIGTRFELREAIQKPRNSVARRMSWAAGRATTREEDRAYSLLGIFSVNMPLLYGEGSRAFVRLQEEIAKESNDLSLLAWTRLEWQIEGRENGRESSKRPGLPEEPCGVLAVSPDEFRLSHDIILRRDTKYNPEFTITNKGLKIIIGSTVTEGNAWRISLGCAAESRPQDTIGMLLRNMGGGVFVRWNANSRIQWRGDHQGHDVTFYVKKSIDWDTQAIIASQLKSLFHRSFHFHAKEAVKFEKAMPALGWIKEQNSFITEGQESFEEFVFCTDKRMAPYGSIHTVSFVVACGFGPDVKAWVCVGSTRGVNRDLFEAAQNADFNHVGVLGKKISQSQSNAIKTKLEVSGCTGRIQTKLRADKGDVLDIIVEIR
ncbi:HET domain-containing protein [Colletotrichum asianum]|uniref:HET domain-containing protein n=1 Tax=Colletotrichum asianum TaxID=702518 RepID=A0A8H3ZP20_9PEZI|nr:HET domain-containing protein [Colletotrichum asianum]